MKGHTPRSVVVAQTNPP